MRGQTIHASCVRSRPERRIVDVDAGDASPPSTGLTLSHHLPETPPGIVVRMCCRYNWHILTHSGSYTPL